MVDRSLLFAGLDDAGGLAGGQRIAHGLQQPHLDLGLGVSGLGGPRGPVQPLLDLFAERFTLYSKYADVTVNCADLTHEDVCTTIIHELRTRNWCI